MSPETTRSLKTAAEAVAGNASTAAGRQSTAERRGRRMEPKLGAESEESRREGSQFLEGGALDGHGACTRLARPHRPARRPRLRRHAADPVRRAARLAGGAVRRRALPL